MFLRWIWNPRTCKGFQNLKSKHDVESPVLGRIIVLFLISGILSLVFSVYSESQILGFIGLGLTFWGSLFLFLRPVNFVEGSLLYNDAFSAYLTIINEFAHKGKGYYIPSYPKEIYLPEYLRSLKDSVVFISAERDSAIPSIEEMAKGKFLHRNPNGAIITPPGSGILTQIEEKSKINFTSIDLNELSQVLPRLILQDLKLVKKMALEVKGDEAHLMTVDSLYNDLYGMRSDLKSVSLLGCPIASAVACALAKTSGRVVTIQKHGISPDGSAVDVWYRIAQG
jgi:hypothetical protein